MSQQTQIFFDEAQRHDALIHELLHGNALGALAPTFAEKRLLATLQYHKGHERAIKIRDLARMCDMTDREVKAAVNALRMDYGVLIGSSKSSSDGGYYLILTDEERRLSAELPAKEIRERAKWLRILSGKHYVVELLGQVQMDMNATEERKS